MTKEQVIIGGIQINQPDDVFEMSIAELKQLVQTAGGQVVAQVTQKREIIDQKTLFGKGKVSEIKKLLEDFKVTTFVINDSITPRQRVLLEEILEVKVIDRTQLILDIFALHATSKAGKLQVGLAQIEYLLPQLSSLTRDLSRLGGGIGTRGPGETKLEQDRRVLAKQKSKIQMDLAKLEKHRELIRKKRQSTKVLQIGLIGYTNAGKSTLLNQVTSAKTLAEDKLFATLDPLTKQFNFEEGLQATLTDTVGFIQDLPTTLIEAFKSTLEESKEMDILLHIVDMTSPMRVRQEETVLNLLKELKMDKIPRLTIYTKQDLSSDFIPTLYPNICVSKDDINLKQKVHDAIKSLLVNVWSPYKKEIPIEESYLIAQIKQKTLVVDEEYDEDKNKFLLKGYKRS